jgi:hypothetical protein
MAILERQQICNLSEQIRCEGTLQISRGLATSITSEDREAFDFPCGVSTVVGGLLSLLAASLPTCKDRSESSTTVPTLIPPKHNDALILTHGGSPVRRGLLSYLCLPAFSAVAALGCCQRGDLSRPELLVARFRITLVLSLLLVGYVAGDWKVGGSVDALLWLQQVDSRILGCTVLSQLGAQGTLPG